MPSVPYMIEAPEPGRALIRFAEICDHTRTTTFDKELSALLETHSHVACDVSRTQVMTSDWFRWLGRLTAKAQKLGKEFVLVGASEGLLETADALDLKKKLNYAHTIEEVWSR